MAPTNFGRDMLLFLLLIVLPVVWASVRLYRQDQHGISNTTFRAAFRRFSLTIVAEAGIFAFVIFSVLLYQGGSLLSSIVTAFLSLLWWIFMNVLAIGKFNNWR